MLHAPHPLNPANVDPSSRAGFVRYELGLASDAVLAGGVGSACAALRVLLADDFDDEVEAASYLAVIRNGAASDSDRAEAVMQLFFLARSAR
jgi:hypothetical protein